MGDLRSAIQHQVRELFGTTEANQIDLSRPPGDDGLFGPASVAWKVHGDLTAMMVGGVAALLLQMLHPGALAGVWDHSGFRRDMRGRLRRTAQFISGTTYGSTATAEALIARVQAVHDRVAGALPDGTPYSANDPALLTWVHAAEAHCFLAGYQRYVDPLFPAAEQDRYLAETAEVARRLGAQDVPTTRAALDTYLRAMRPALRYDHRTREVSQALIQEPAPTLALRPFQKLTMDAGFDLLPDWAQRMHGRVQPVAGRIGLRAGVAGVGAVMRWALRKG
jgi:uncharacterized protein (DUF2236 family)